MLLLSTEKTKICELTNCDDPIVYQEIGVRDKLIFQYPISDENTQYIALEEYIITDENEYVIKERNVVDDEYIEVVAEVNLEDFETNMEDYEYNPVLKYKNWYKDDTPPYTKHVSGLTGTLADVTGFQAMLHQMHLNDPGSYPDVTEWTVTDHTGTEFDGITREINLGVCNLYGILTAVQEKFFVELRFDAINHVIHVWSPNSAPNMGSYFAEQLNLESITTQSDSYDFATMLIPTGKNGLNICSITGVTRPAPLVEGRPLLRHPAGQNYLIDTTYSDKIVLKFWDNSDCEDAGELFDDAVKVLMSKSAPARNAYKAKIVDLSAQSGYEILAYSLGDVVKVLAASKLINETQRIVKLEKHLKKPELNACEIANKSTTLANLNELSMISPSSGGGIIVNGEKIPLPVYTWYKYADSPTSGMSDSPDGKAYMGVSYGNTSPIESTNYGDYTWSLIQGADGPSLYTWVKYAMDEYGADMSDDPSGRTYMGVATNQTSQTESSDPALYTWIKIQGPIGETGMNGVDANLLDWVGEWDGLKVDIKEDIVISPKIFAGSNSGTVETPILTGIAIGRDLINATKEGIIGYKDNVATFKLSTDGSAVFGTEAGRQFKVNTNGSIVTPNITADTITSGTLDASLITVTNRNSIANVTFIGQTGPTPPYYVGDLWSKSDGDSAATELYRCIYTQLTGEYDFNAWEPATNYDKTRTTINGGLVTTGTIQLSDGTLIKAGITATGAGDTNIRFWAGDTYANRATAPFRVNQAGLLTCTNANITGGIINIGSAATDYAVRIVGGDYGGQIGFYDSATEAYVSTIVYNGESESLQFFGSPVTIYGNTTIRYAQFSVVDSPGTTAVFRASGVSSKLGFFDKANAMANQQVVPANSTTGDIISALVALGLFRLS